MYQFIVSFLIFLVLCILINDCKSQLCPEFNVCNTSNEIKLFVSVNQHLDAYWLATFEQYYNGNSNNTQVHAIARQIYYQLIKSLQDNPNRTTILSEVNYFKRWWDEATDQKRNDMTQLIKSGRVEFVNGGWVQNDEALTYYEDVIDQFMIGHQFLKKAFNITPQIAASMDNFGHSAAMVSLYSQMGFNAYFIERASQEEKEELLKQQKLEFLWEPEISTGLFKDSLFTHINLKKHFTWDWQASIQYLKNCKTKQQKLDVFDKFMKDTAKGQNANNIFYYFGDDFQIYDNKRFLAIESVQEFYNSNPCLNISIQYSNATTYFQQRLQQINEQKNFNWKFKTQDFLPYRDDEQYWTGFYSTQPRFKFIIRQGSRFLQSIKNFFTKCIIILPLIQEEKIQIIGHLLKLEEEMATNTHHDAITSTSKYWIIDNAIKEINVQISQINQIQQNLLISLIKQKQNLCIIKTEELLHFQSCNYTINDKCFDILKSQQNLFIISIFNPTLERLQVIELNVLPQNEYQIYNIQMEEIYSEVVCITPEQGYCSMFFKYEFKSFDVNFFILKKKQQLNNNQKLNNTLKEIKLNGQQSLKLNIDNIRQLQIFQGFQDFIYSQCKQDQQESCNFQYQFKINYTQVQNVCKKTYSKIKKFYIKVCPGKYSMKSDGETESQFDQVITAYYYQSQLLTIVKLEYQHQYITIVLKIFPQQTFKGIQIDTNLDIISINQEADYMMTITSPNINSNDIFYTDSNGLYMMKRQINKREDFIPEIDEYDQIAANVYPITSMAYIQDINTHIRMQIITDRAQGMTSLQSGELRFFIERKAFEDNEGLGEPLSKLEKQRYQHNLLFLQQNEYEIARLVQQDLEQIFLVNIANLSAINEKLENCNIEIPLTTQFNYDLQLKIIARPQEKNQILLRLENILETKSLHIDFYNKNFNYILNQISGSNITRMQERIEEYSLSGAQTLQNILKNKWNWKNTSYDIQQQIISNDTSLYQLTLSPLQIRVFLITYTEDKIQNVALTHLQCQLKCKTCKNQSSNCLICTEGRNNDPPFCTCPSGSHNDEKNKECIKNKSRNGQIVLKEKTGINYNQKKKF